MLRRRVPPETSAASQDHLEAKRTAAMWPTRDEAIEVLLPDEVETVPPSYASLPSGTTGPAAATMKLDKRSAWMVFAVASGTCAAFNGVFAKLCVALFKKLGIESEWLIKGT